MEAWTHRRGRLVEDLRLLGIRDERVLEAIGQVPRHRFVPERWQRSAYDDAALDIGAGQTISKPSVVARMAEAARLRPDGRVLEVGTGSGYGAALLARLVRFVFSVERIPELAERAKQTLDALGIENVSVKVMDGSLGWKAQAPYDAIIVTASAPEMPNPLLSQLSAGGRMVVPVGDAREQGLVLVERRGSRWIERRLGSATFVPLIGRAGWRRTEDDG